MDFFDEYVVQEKDSAEVKALKIKRWKRLTGFDKWRNQEDATKTS